MKKLISIILFASLALSSGAQAELDDDYFPVDDEMRVRVNFWKRVYTDIKQNEAFLHDNQDVTLIYETFKFKSKSRRGKRREAKAKKRKYRNILRSIARKKKKNLNKQETRVLELIGEDRSIRGIRKLAKQIRHQRGLRDQYLIGLSRSLAILDDIKAAFRKEGIPEGLAYLPHVESSFNHMAYSKVGAAGLWQFMRSTARIYGLKLSYVVDQRRDTEASTRAAARFLRDNYDRLGSWPLALTAYNHGPVSIERAARTVGTKDLSKIIKEYKGRRFGFASKNFYATFIATAELSQDYKKHFGDIKPAKKLKYSELKLAKPVTVRQLSKIVGASPKTLQRYNPGLRPIAFRRQVYLPKGYRFRVPQVDQKKMGTYLAAVSKIKGGPGNLKSGGSHIVSRGESLYEISRVYRVSLSDIIILNQMSNPRHIRPGMKIKIPGSGFKGKKIARTRVVKPKKKPKKERVKPPNQTLVASVADDDTLFIRASRKKSEWNQRFLVDVSEITRNELEFDPDEYHFETKKIKGGVYQIVVETDETLGHYADWLGIPTSRIRSLNRFRFSRAIHLGQKIKIPASQKKLVNFNLKRIEYHQAIEEDLFSNYKIEGSDEYVVRRGDSLAEITRKLQIPVWLLRKHSNHNLKSVLHAGQRLRIPVLASVTEQPDSPTTKSD